MKPTFISAKEALDKLIGVEQLNSDLEHHHNHGRHLNTETKDHLNQCEEREEEDGEKVSINDITEAEEIINQPGKEYWVWSVLSQGDSHDQLHARYQ